MKKLLAMTLAGAMVFSMPVLAATSPSADSYSTVSSGTSSSPVSAVTASSIPEAVIRAAEGENKTVGEYLNNAITSVPGLENVTPLGQGGHVIINGAPSNQTFSVMKPERQSVESAKSLASSLGGKVLNVAKIQASVSGFNTATVNFYLKGIKTGQNIKIYQYVNGQWIELTVTEIRDDHVVVNMTSLGTLAFIEVPAVSVPNASKSEASESEVPDAVASGREG